MPLAGEAKIGNGTTDHKPPATALPKALLDRTGSI